MPAFVSLMKFSDQGIKNIKEAPDRIQDAFDKVEKMGGKIINFYAVWGEYDYVAISEFPSEEIATAFILKLGSLGNVKATTLRAFTVEEFTEIVKKIP
jgi:uncharacterized protein with GYD domain